MKQYLYDTYYQYIANNVYSDDEEIKRVYCEEDICDRFMVSPLKFEEDINELWKFWERKED